MRNSLFLIILVAASGLVRTALCEESLPAKEYLQFTDSPEIPADKIQWAPKSGTVLTLAEGQRPSLELKGSVGDGRQLWIGDQPVSDKNGNFTHTLPLPPEPLTIALRVGSADKGFETYQRVYYWIKAPPSIRFKVMEGEKVISKSAGYTGKLKKQAFTQLMSKGAAIPVVDLDTLRYHNLAFQITYPKDTGQAFDGWALMIRDEAQNVVAEIRKYGPPPAFVDFSEVANRIQPGKTYVYRTDLFQEENIFDGAEATFEARSGQFVAEPAGMPTVYLEAKQEIGYLSFKNDESIDIGALYAGIDVPVTLYNKYILRAGAIFALPTVSATHQMSIARGGIGTRLFDLFGSRVDATLTYSNYSFSPAASVQSLSQIGLLIEPHILYGNVHYLLPHLEIAGDTSFKAMRGSIGMSYQIFVRPWSMRLGIGVSYDRLFKYPDHPSMHFGLFRMATSATFII